MYWNQLTLFCNKKDVDDVEEFLLTLNAQALTNENNNSEPIFAPGVVKDDDKQIWSKVKMKALFLENENLNKIKQKIKEKFNEEIFNSVKFKKIQEQNWQAICQNNFTTTQFGDNLIIYPSWEQPPNTLLATVCLDPGMGFGTGSHPTTSLCLEYLAQNVIKEKNQTVIDFGCGSGILAIAAYKLGASKVLAIDNDPDAVISTKENAKKNNIDVGKDFICYHTNDFNSKQSYSADIVVANILVGPLCELSSILVSLVKPKGTLVLSGILDTQVKIITDCYAKHFSNYDVTFSDEWVRITFQA